MCFEQLPNLIYRRLIEFRIPIQFTRRSINLRQACSISVRAIFGMGNPLQILYSVIRFNAIFVVDFRLTQRVWNEGGSDQTMN